MAKKKVGGSVSSIEREIGVFLLLNPSRVEDLWDLLEKYEPTMHEFGELLRGFRLSLERYNSYLFVEEFLADDVHNFWVEQQQKFLHLKDALDRLSYYRAYLIEKVKQQRLKSKVNALKQVVDRGVLSPSTILERLHSIYQEVGEGERETSTEELPSLLVDIVEGRKVPKTHPFLFLRELFGYAINIYCNDLTIIAGRTGRGKTTVALNVAYSYMLAGGKVCYITTEMDEIAIATRFAAIVAGVPWEHLWGEKINKESVEVAIKRLEEIREKEGKVFFYHAPYCTLSHISYALGKAKAAFDGEDLDCFIVDYVQQVAVEGRREESRAQELAVISRHLADLATQYSCAGIAISQVNDAGEVKDSRAIAERAALVVKIGMLSPLQFSEAILHMAGILSGKKIGVEILKRKLAILMRRYLDVCVAKNRYGYYEPNRIEFVEWNPEMGRIIGAVDKGRLVNLVRALHQQIMTGEVEEVSRELEAFVGGNAPVGDVHLAHEEEWKAQSDEVSDTTEPFTLI